MGQLFFLKMKKKSQIFGDARTRADFSRQDSCNPGRIQSGVCTLPRPSTIEIPHRKIHLVLIEISHVLGLLTKPFRLHYQTQMGAPGKHIDLTFVLPNSYFVDNIDNSQRFTNYNQRTMDSTRAGDCLDFSIFLKFSRQDKRA